MSRVKSLAVTLAVLAGLVGPGPSGSVTGEPPSHAEAMWAAKEERREQMRALSPFSIVTAPPDVEVKATGSGESDLTYRYWRARAEGSISPVELVEHYVAGLEALGWTFRPAVEEGAVALRTGEHRDSEGATWHVLALAAPSFALAGRCSIVFQLTRVA